MTTPAQNINAASAATKNFKEWARPSGKLLQNVDSVVVGRRMVVIRAASVNNPKRPDGTRQPSSWASRGGFAGGASGFAQTVTATRRREWTGQIVSPPTTLGSIPAVIPTATGNSYVLRKALGHFGEPEARLGVALREAKETVGLTTQYYRAASRFFGELTEDLARGVRGGRNSAMRWNQFLDEGWTAVPSRYLEYLYGMRPLADEISNAVDVLTDMKEQGHGFQLTLRDRYTIQDATQLQLNGVTNAVAKCRGLTTQTHRASLVFSLPSWYWETMGRPVTAFREAWEVARLSFVLDWVFPVKNWLHGFEGFQLRPFFKEGSVSVFLERRITSVELDKGVNPGLFLAQSLSTQGWREYFLSRQSLSTFPSEAVMRLPRLRNTLGLDKMDQMAALAGQRLAALQQVLRRARF